MATNEEHLVKKIQTALKFGGFIVRKEFCSLIVSRFLKNKFNLYDQNIFDDCISGLSKSFESQCLMERSIEKGHINQALEVCLHSGYDKNETIFNVIGAFDFPKLVYNLDRKQYFPSTTKSKFLSNGTTKAQLFIDRYTSILQRTRRNFIEKLPQNEELKLHSVDYLLTLSYVSLERILILGALLQVSEGTYYLEDPTGIVQLDLTHAKYHEGFFVENCFVLVNGYYEDKILKVSTIILPPGEEYKESKSYFGNLNYFGGSSPTLLKNSVKLHEYLLNHPHNMLMFFSDVWLDHPLIFEKLQRLFDGIQSSPPVAFIFIGNFISESYCDDMFDTLKKLFKEFGELIASYPSLVNQSHFVFVPGLGDPCITHMVPRFTLPKAVTRELIKSVPNAIFTTNPCRIQYCTREIVIFRADILPKLLQSTLYKSTKQDLTNNVNNEIGKPIILAKTIVSQGHLSPLSLNALTVHWDFDYTLRLYPLPDLIVIGDKSEGYEGQYKGCYVVNPGSFCDSGFQFKTYTPTTNIIHDCVL